MDGGHFSSRGGMDNSAFLGPPLTDCASLPRLIAVRVRLSRNDGAAEGFRSRIVHAPHLLSLDPPLPSKNRYISAEACCSALLANIAPARERQSRARTLPPWA